MGTRITPGRLLAICAVSGCTALSSGSVTPPSPVAVPTGSPGLVQFRSDHVEIVDGADVFSIQTVDIGRDRSSRPMRLTPSLRAVRPEDATWTVGAEYALGSAMEWWTGNVEQAEQGWTLGSRAPGEGPVRLRVRLVGATAARRDDQSLRLTGARGGSWRVDRLRAVDARGSEIPAGFVLSQDGFDVVVDDSNAAYPIEVDPFYTIPDWEVYGTSATGTPTAVAMGDFDSDGYSDLAGLSSGVVKVYRGTAEGLEESAALSLGEDGDAVANAGDVNGDGYTDLVVGVPDEAAIVVYEGSPTGLRDEGTTIVSAVAGTGDNFGSSVAGAGDVDGDGYDDVVVGAYARSWGYGAVFFGSASGLADAPAFESLGSDYFGWRVGGAGDVNGDGFGDVAIAGSSTTSLFHGSSVGLPTTADSVLAPEANPQDLAGVGDLNDDGYGDFAIAYVDTTYVYPGGGGGLAATDYTVLTDGSGSLADVGDVDLDGLDDLVVGASGGFDPSILLYLGDPLFVGTTPTATATTSTNSYYGYDLAAGDIDDDGAQDVVTIDREWEDVGAVFVYPGSETASLSLGQTLVASSDDQLGYSYANLGDVNGDGYDDAAIGAYGYGASAGRVAVYTGSATGLSGVPANEWAGVESYGCFGSSVDGAGDVNGDGFGDVIVGEWNYDGGAGAVFVYHGGATGLPATPSTISLGVSGTHFGRVVTGLGDVNADGFADIGVLGNGRPALIYLGSSAGVGAAADASLGEVRYGDAQRLAAIGDIDGDGVRDVSLEGQRGAVIQVFTGATTGLTAAGELTVSGHTFGDGLAGAGDFDGDGYDDLAVGDDERDGGSGRIYAVAGGASGLVERGAVDGTYGEGLGLAMVAAGDVDGDGRDDLFAKGNTVRLEVFLGSADGFAPDPAFTDLDQLLAYTFDAGDFNGDGWLDVLSGNPEADDGAGAAYVYPGGADADGDGYLSFEDCDDADASIVPVTRYVDADGDGVGDPNGRANACPAAAGYVDDATDCDDADVAVHPGASEVCDAANVDEDCDGLADDADPDATGQTTFYQDADNDNHGVVTVTKPSCDAGLGWAAVGDDCDDADAHVHPGRDEICDANDVDEDCNGLADDADPTGRRIAYYQDTDGDGYGTGDATRSCDPVPGSVTQSGDCDDGDPGINPGASELCGTLVDEDCDGGVDDDPTADLATWYRDGDGDGYGQGPHTLLSCSQPDGHGVAGDCDDRDPATHPGGAEIDADGVDEDCDGLEACYLDQDADGARGEALAYSDDVECSGDGVALADAELDCDDTNPDVRPGSFESTGDGIDGDCDGVEQCWQDADGDGFRSPYATVASSDEDCTDHGEAMTSNATDCDDSDPSAHPGADPVCDGNDHDCDGYVDQHCDKPPAAAEACGCGAVQGPPLGGTLLGLAMWARRRARKAGGGRDGAGCDHPAAAVRTATRGFPPRSRCWPRLPARNATTVADVAYSAPMLTLLLCLAGSDAQAAYLGSIGDDVTIPTSGTFATIAVDESGAYTLFWAAGGDYNAAPLAPDFSVDTQQRVRLSGHTDLIDHAIRRCPDGTWLHSASASVSHSDDTAWIFTYDADLNLTNEVLLDDQDATIRHNDMALWCGDKRVVGFVRGDGSQWIVDLNPDGTEIERSYVVSLAQLQGGQFWEDPTAADGGDGLLYLLGRTMGHDAELTTLDADLNLIATVGVPSLSPTDEYAYWLTGLVRVGEYFLVAHMGRDDGDGWSQDTGNVYLSVLSVASGTVVEQVAVTNYAPGSGAMRPWATRDGNDLLITWDVSLAPHVSRVSFDAEALGELVEPDTGGAEDTSDNGGDDTSGSDSRADDSGGSNEDTSSDDGQAGSPDLDRGAGGGCGCATGGRDPGITALGLFLLAAAWRRSRVPMVYG